MIKIIVLKSDKVSAHDFIFEICEFRIDSSAIEIYHNPKEKNQNTCRFRMK